MFSRKGSKKSTSAPPHSLTHGKHLTISIIKKPELFTAIDKQDVLLLAAVLDEGLEDVNTREDLSGATALLMAVRTGHEGMVRILLEHGADATLAAYSGERSLDAAVGLMSSVNILSLLLDHTPNFSQQLYKGRCLLRQAVSSGSLASLQCLLAHGADPRVTDSEGICVIALVSPEDPAVTEKYRLLLAAGADANSVDKNGKSCLIKAATASLQAVTCLLAHGACVNQTSRDGKTSLFYAMQHDKVENVKALLQGGAKPDVRDHSGKTALIFAASLGSAPLVSVLLSHGGLDVNEKDYQGYSALHHAARFHHLAVIRRLLKYGADPNQPGMDGNTSLMEATTFFGCTRRPMYRPGLAFKEQAEYHYRLVPVPGIEDVAGLQMASIEALLDSGAHADFRNHFRHAAVHMCRVLPRKLVYLLTFEHDSLKCLAARKIVNDPVVYEGYKDDLKRLPAILQNFIARHYKSHHETQ